MGRDRVAIVGAGIAGLVTAYLLRERYEVALFEAGDHVGGHVTTFVVPSGPDCGLPLDLGFMVMNRRNYPLLYRLLEELGVGDVRATEMSFGYWEEDTGFQYAINWDPAGDPGRGLDRAHPAAEPRELRGLLPANLRFQRAAVSFLEGSADPPFGSFLESHDLRGDVVDRYLIPMTAAIWSTDPARMIDFPARPLLTFFDNHGLLSLGGGPCWEHVHGGAARYVDALVGALPPGTIRRQAVCGLRRCGEGVEIAAADGTRQCVGWAVLACHADEARSLLTDATRTEAEALGAWTYQRNLAILHSDDAVMPPRRNAWASWNFVRPAGSDGLVVTYHLNRLQGHGEARAQYFVSLNRKRPVDDSKVLARVAFTHPVYGPDSFRAQERLRSLPASGRVLFCGSYMGHGFHEDAVRSAHDVARALGVER